MSPKLLSLFVEQLNGKQNQHCPLIRIDVDGHGCLHSLHLLALHHTAASQPKRKTSRSTPSQRAITQLNCYITAKIAHMYSGQAQSRDPICAIAAVKTDEVHTCDLKKQTSPMMENLFSSNQPMLGLVLKFSEDFLSPFD